MKTLASLFGGGGSHRASVEPDAASNTKLALSEAFRAAAKRIASRIRKSPCKARAYEMWLRGHATTDTDIRSKWLSEAKFTDL